MRYASTRGGETGVPFERALLSAYASDGGLFVPETVPKIPLETRRSWASLHMSQVCARIMEQYTDLSLAQLENEQREMASQWAPHRRARREIHRTLDTFTAGLHAAAQKHLKTFA